jgi:hypothetical protein
VATDLSLCDAMTSEAVDTVHTIFSTPSPATAAERAVVAYNMGVETGLVLALETPEGGRRLLAAIDAVINGHDARAVVVERQQVLDRYRLALEA